MTRAPLVGVESRPDGAAMRGLTSIVLYASWFIGASSGAAVAMVRAADAGDDAGVVELLTEPRARLLGWIELALVAVIVVLMVLRPA